MSLGIALPATEAAAAQYKACGKAKGFKTALKVDLEVPEPQIDMSVNRKQLNVGHDKIHSDWVQRNGMQTIWKADEMETLGLAAGGWALFHTSKFLAKPYDQYGTSWCPFFQKIEIGMMYRTIIHVPNDYKPGSCEYNIIMAHEMLHHETNATVAQIMVGKLREALPMIVAEVEHSAPAISRSKVNNHFKYMDESLKGAIDVFLTQTMQTEMQKRNHLIDSPAEYERASKAIADCKKKKT